MFTNKEDFKEKPEIYIILTALEKAHKNNDTLSAGILLKRLENFKITLVSENNACKFGFIPVESK